MSSSVSPICRSSTTALCAPASLGTPFEESLMAFMAWGRPSFWKDPKPYPELGLVEAWLDQQLGTPRHPREPNLTRVALGAAD